MTSRTTLDLTRNWSFQAPDGAWLPAEVPGCIHKDLLRHGLIPDPFYGRNELELGWIAERAWLYRLAFTAPADIRDHEHLDLVFDGLDTVATVLLNGMLLYTVAMPPRLVVRVVLINSMKPRG